MKVLCQIVSDTNGNRDAELQLLPADAQPTVTFKLNAKSCRALAQQLTNTADELERAIVLPFAAPLCGVCAGTLKGFNSFRSKYGGKWVHFGPGGQGSYYECRNPPQNGEGVAQH